MTIRQFVESLFNNCREGVEFMTVEEAEYDIANFKAEGWKLPENLTAEEYAKIWNSLI